MVLQLVESPRDAGPVEAEPYWDGDDGIIPTVSAAGGSSSESCSSSPSPLEDVLGSLKTNNVNEEERALTVLGRILINLERYPSESRYRRLRRGNERLCTALTNLEGGPEVLNAVGFYEEGDYWVISESAASKAGECLESLKKWTQAKEEERYRRQRDERIQQEKMKEKQFPDHFSRSRITQQQDSYRQQLLAKIEADRREREAEARCSVPPSLHNHSKKEYNSNTDEDYETRLYIHASPAKVSDPVPVTPQIVKVSTPKKPKKNAKNNSVRTLTDSDPETAVSPLDYQRKKKRASAVLVVSDSTPAEAVAVALAVAGAAPGVGSGVVGSGVGGSGVGGSGVGTSTRAGTAATAVSTTTVPTTAVAASATSSPARRVHQQTTTTVVTKPSHRTSIIPTTSTIKQVHSPIVSQPPITTTVVRRLGGSSVVSSHHHPLALDTSSFLSNSPIVLTRSPNTTTTIHASPRSTSFIPLATERLLRKPSLANSNTLPVGGVGGGRNNNVVIQSSPLISPMYQPRRFSAAAYHHLPTTTNSLQPSLIRTVVPRMTPTLPPTHEETVRHSFQVDAGTMSRMSFGR